VLGTYFGARRAGSRGGVIGLGKGISDLAGFLADESWGLSLYVLKIFK
jgi:hypothetical protein